MISSISPGKLYIAGEYAVVNKGYPAIIVAVDQFIKVSLKAAEKIGSIKAYDNVLINFKREREKVVLDYRDNRLNYVINSINVVESLASDLNKDFKFYDLHIESDLESDDGKKYGLGSSAAVTVSTIKVLCKFYEIKVTKKQLFKLAVIAHAKINSNGSAGDLAASIYGGWIYYKTFDRDWLKEKLTQFSVEKLINMDWPYLEIKSLEPPKDLNLKIGWTQKPASTTLLVDNLNKKKNKFKEFYNDFLKASRRCVNTMVKAFETDDVDTIQKQININRKLLLSLGKKFEMQIETDKLSNLCNVANELEGAAKSSGAGGGDCGIAIFRGEIKISQLKNAWHQVGVEYLALNVYTEGE